jgi:DNA modification methylase
MQTIPISQIQIIDRQRTEIGDKPLQELKVGILSKGLLHAPVLSKEPDGSFRLRAGERRIRAMESLHTEGHEFNYNGQPVPTDHIPYVLTSDLSEADLFELELEENILRADLPWMDKCNAIEKLHRLRELQNPGQTITATAKELAAHTGKSIAHEHKRVAHAQLIMANKDNPEVKRSKNQDEAIKRILDQKEDKFKALLNLTKTVSKESPHKIIHGDCRDILPTLQAGIINTVISDPPYGINANQSGQESKHFYDDSPEYSLEMCEYIISQSFRLLAERGILLMFHDIEHFVHLRDYAKRQAFSVYRTPLIWYKGVGGRTPWGRAGFKRSYETILYAVKGQDELLMPGGDDVLTFKQSRTGDRDHAASKPFELLSRLVELTTLKGELILDPTCGSGTIIPAADRHGARTICIEMDQLSYQKAVNRAAGEEIEEHGDSEDEESSPELTEG